MKIFYCAKCNKLEADFEISETELKVRRTWSNIRDGYGGAITHMICPECGYVLSGFINWYKEVDDSVLNYVKYSIELYSTRDGGMLREGALDYICNQEIERKRNTYADCKDEEILGILESMSTMSEDEE